MSPSLLALLDDITVVLDDVASMTKLATKKTAGVLTDDLAVNAQQVVGVQASREIPVVWSVAKGSLINKLLIIPAALLINAFAPWLMVVLLIIGGAYLCFEGAEKIHHTLFHKNNNKQKALLNETDEVITDEMIQKMEKDKIKGAIRTDFILSAEIIVITLHTVSNYSLMIQIMTLLSIAVLITVGVYGLVAGIIKMDDLGYWMMKNAKATSLKAKMGLMLINAAPYLMKILGFIGTVAMFLVGGGIIIGEVPQLIALQNNWITMLNESFFKHFIGTTYSFILGFLVGYIVLAGHTIYITLFKKVH
ncbi:DUF808 domain-containing protein [Wohlfahrtiimonas larvae]|uniref:DUF808 domain-containing protein n=1 Tax=Wohlfahrtiimonas larvae TaxID=1157986 RepID=A0ABP9MDX0_9GAMM|nr:DUF808 domain-containing protein [Wohlfahrtiimonas larvae]